MYGTFNRVYRVPVMIVCQKLDVILESKVVQKLSLEKNVFNKQWSPRFIFLVKNFFLKRFD